MNSEMINSGSHHFRFLTSHQ